MVGSTPVLTLVLGGVVALSGCTSSQPAQAGPTPGARGASTPVLALSGQQVEETLTTYCVVCHNQRAGTANLGIDTLDISNPSAHPATWEKVIVKLRAGTMPPGGMPRPDPETYDALATWLENQLDRAWEANPNPGRIASVHRLNRTEYNNAIRDLLALDVDVTSMLPGDASADGSFDNMASSLTISPIHLERYLTVARYVTRLAVGLPPNLISSAEFGLPRDNLQEDMRGTDLPLGSRGGISARWVFPVDGEYEIRVFLHRNYQDYVIGMGWPQLLDVRVDGALANRFTVGGGARGFRAPALGYAGDGEPGFEGDTNWESYVLSQADAGLVVRTFVKAGPRVVGVSFPRDMFELDGIGNPAYGATGEYLLSEQYMVHARVAEVRIAGPYSTTGTVEETPSRREIFVCQPQSPAQEPACAREILSRMARRAYRRPVTNEDMTTLLEFFSLGRLEGQSFEAGIQMALERMLVDPDFLLRVYRDPPSRVASTGGYLPNRADPYPLSDLEVASRLAFFLWSSVPDAALLDLAEQGRLTDPTILRQQTQRMLADPRAADALVKGFVGQWLNLRLLEEVTPNYAFIRSAGRGLLDDFPVETELFVGSTLREDRSIVELLNADYTFLNERLARHYEIPNVYGSHFRRVTLPNRQQRGGLLGQAGILALTSYPDRTSPVLRGKWLLDNILDAPVPPPPSNVNTTLEANPGEENLPIREQLARHRQDPVCSSCHSVMDPLGFALESFDPVGRWRNETGDVDDSGVWPDGREMNGFVGLRQMLVDRSDEFAATVTRKLMSYALGRELEYYDMPMVRRIVRDAARNDYRWSSLVLGIVESPAFLMRAYQTD